MNESPFAAWNGFDAAHLPRYEFTQTHVGCAMHGDPICLCDVDMSKPVSIDANTVMFGELARQALGADQVDGGNIYEWAQLLLGMHGAYKSLGDREGTVEKEPSYMDGTTAWSRLPDGIRQQMVAGYYDKIPWSVAAKWLPELSKEDRTSIYKYYNQRLYAKNTQRKKG